jgi:hypothetical protein
VGRLRHRLATLVLLALAAGAAPARADWLIVPFAGATFGGETTSFLNLESGAGGAKSVYGVAGAWLPTGILGLEGEFLYGPNFFQNRNALLVSSHISTLSGGLLMTLPLSVTRESLRPYVTAGVGTMLASADYSLDFLDQSPRFATLHVGAGAIGFVSPDVGVRFDLRHVNSLNRVQDELTNIARSRLRFWRLTVGVVLRVG